MSVGILGMGVLFPGAVGLTAAAEALARPPPSAPELISLPEADARERRLPRVERMALRVAREALGGATPSPALGLTFGTGMGGMSATIAYLEGIAGRGASYGSPTAFHQSVHHSSAGQLSIALGLRGPSLTLSSRELSGETALRVGLDLLESGRAEQVLVVAADEWAPALTAGYRAFGALAPEEAPPSAGGLWLGEGAAAVLLGRAATPLQLVRCSVTAHLAGVLHFSRPKRYRKLLEAALPGAPSAAFSLAAPTDALRAAERDAVQQVAAGMACHDDVARTGFHASAGLVRLVLAALRLQQPGGPQDAFVHGLALGGGQALTHLRHDPR